MRRAPIALLLLMLMLAALGHEGTARANADAQHGHPAPLFHRIVIELDYADRDGGLVTGDLRGWIGGDLERLWLRAEGEAQDGDTETLEFQVYYGWSVHEFWDVLIGLRQDVEPENVTYAALSLTGMLPHFIETEASLFLSDEGRLSARLEHELDLRLTQALVLEPHLEIDLYAQDEPGRAIGAGVASAELGLKLRYEITPKFAPNLDLVWERKLGETAQRTRALGEDVEETTVRLGLRVWF